MRRVISFHCAGETLVGTLDEASGSTGLLIVSGGNELRMGAFRGMALLAARLAAEGVPVFRYDRRGIGDSTGENREFETTAEDLAAAAAAFREHGKVERVVAFGNCDAASALAMFHQQAGIDRMVLANPWTIEPTDNLPPAAAIRARYAERLRDPREWLRLLRGGVNIAGVLRGLAKISKKAPEQPAGLPTRVAAGLANSECPATVLLAKGDNTAIAFRECWDSDGFATARQRVAIEELDSNSHSFARAGDKDWLYKQLKAALTSPS